MLVRSIRLKKVVLKKEPNKRGFIYYLKNILKKCFKERTFVSNKKGRFIYYHISPVFQIIVLLLFILLCYWTIFTTNIYFFNVDILKEKDKQVKDARNKFNKTIVDIKAYRDTINVINEKIETSQKDVINLLKENKSITKIEKNNLIKNQLLLSTELNYINSQLDNYADDIKWANAGLRLPIYKTTKNELEKNIVLNENILLKNRNNILELSLNNMKELQFNLVDKITILANDKIKDIEQGLKKIDGILAQVNLKNRNTLIKKVRIEKGEGLGERYIPLQDIDLTDEELSEKFKNANIKVNLWEGLSKATTMLPLGSPVRTRLRITSPFGVRSDPFNNTLTMHNGIDFGGKIGTPLYTTSAGKVVRAGKRGDYGLAVEVDHGLGFSTLYAHLSKINVKRGDILESGTKVGLAGSTGRSTGVHLHYELRYNNRPLNPYTFVKINNK